MNDLTTVGASHKRPYLSWINFAAVVVLLLSLVLRLQYGFNSSFFIDDFCSLHHAKTPDLGTFFGSIRQDITPPLYYALLRFTVSILGDSEIACRLPGIIASLANILLVGIIAKRFLQPGSCLLAMAVFGMSSLNLEMSALVRTFTLLSLAITGLFGALLGTLQKGKRAWPIALWTAIGLYSHYFFIHYLLLLGVTTVIFRMTCPTIKARTTKSIAWLVIGCLVSIPWYYWGFLHQLSHGPAPGGTVSSLRIFAESLIHLQYVNLSIAGSALAQVFIGCGLLALTLAGLTFIRGFIAPGDPNTRMTVSFLAVASVGVPAFAAFTAWLTARSGFSWAYISGSAPPLALLIAGALGRTTGLFSIAKRAGLAGILISSTALAIMIAHSAGKEDFRGAIGTVISQAAANDAVIPIEWTPQHFPQGMPWDYYSARLPKQNQFKGTRLRIKNWMLVEPIKLHNYKKVFLINRNVPPDQSVFGQLRNEFARESVQSFGYSLSVHTFFR